MRSGFRQIAYAVILDGVSGVVAINTTGFNMCSMLKQNDFDEDPEKVMERCYERYFLGKHAPQSLIADRSLTRQRAVMFSNKTGHCKARDMFPSHQH